MNKSAVVKTSWLGQSVRVPFSVQSTDKAQECLFIKSIKTSNATKKRKKKKERVTSFLSRFVPP